MQLFNNRYGRAKRLLADRPHRLLNALTHRLSEALTGLLLRSVLQRLSTTFARRHRTGICLTAFLLIAALHTFAQTDATHSVVSWDFTTQQGADGKPVLVLHGHILDGWRLYSTTMADSLPNSRVTLDSTA